MCSLTGLGLTEEPATSVDTVAELATDPVGDALIVPTSVAIPKWKTFVLLTQQSPITLSQQ